MRNFESDNDYTDVVSGIYESPEYQLSKLPMVITNAEGKIIDANKAFSVFAGLEDEFQTKNYNLFELSGIKPSNSEQPISGIWAEKTSKFNQRLKNFLYSSTPIENAANINLRLYTFIDSDIIPEQEEKNTKYTEKNISKILPEIENWPHHLHKQAGVAHWKISFGENLFVETLNLFELLSVEEPKQPVTIEDVLHKKRIHPDDLPAYNEMLQQVEAQRLTTYDCNYRIVCDKDSVKYIQNHACLKYDDHGNLCTWEVILQDITSFKKPQLQKPPAFQTSKLIHSQSNLSLLLKVTHQAVSSHMPVHDLCLVLNKEKDLTFHRLSAFDFTTEKREYKNGLIEHVLETGEPMLVSATDIEHMLSNKMIVHDEPIPQSWVGIPLKTSDSTVGALCIQSSTQETIYNEDDKAILLFIAEQITLAAQKIKSEAWLIKAKNSAENSSRLKSSLLANMSHELRTPMTGILGFSEILTEELDDPRLKSMAGTIFKSAGRLMSTLNSIIDLSALEADKNSVKLESINTRLMMQPLLKVAYSIASDKGLYLRTSIPSDLYIKADEKLLSQLLHHLIDNALKFTIDGGVSISAYKLNKTSSTATIRINDTGIGIASEHHKMIFDDFRQVSEGFSRTFEGSGLGLSLCSKISRLLNAKMWVDSIEGTGSDFYVELPVSLPETIERPGTSTVPAIRTHRLGRGSVPDVLIVEDNEINRRLAALYLREICNTEMAENGYVAIEKIKRKKYDAILMDINLGAGPDGLSIAQQTKGFEINKNTPIIAVTGYTMHGDKEKLLSNGCSHYLPKPYDKQSLLKLFTEILYEQSV